MNTDGKRELQNHVSVAICWCRGHLGCTENAIGYSDADTLWIPISHCLSACFNYVNVVCFHLTVTVKFMFEGIEIVCTPVWRE